ncbi:MAG: hypothetical protein Q8K05_05440 [Polaromonas sp.]|uniref:hypothetical protein n=1 Tax=Polaromonas sp. TaxID=1869339 RepID=UPI0027311BF6|nr:hypothetical protein [Polaromonas sp.]MDP2255491.1 hypothetical protein [Polaromonas sp.]
MNKQPGKRVSTLMALMGISVLAGCAASQGPSAAALYRCEQGLEFTARFVDDTAVLQSKRGAELLYRDAGGQGNKQTVYSNPQLRAEFGLGAGGREAVLHYLLPPLESRCVRN